MTKKRTRTEKRSAYSDRELSKITEDMRVAIELKRNKAAAKNESYKANGTAAEDKSEREL